MSERVPIGVVGTGHLGALHTKMLAGSAIAVLAGVYDVDPARAASVAAQYGTRAFPSLEALLAEVEAVTIATPTSTHHATACRALAQGKHIFIEKPITQTIEEADELCVLARNKGRIIQVGHIERFNPAILALDRYTINPMFVESHRLAQFNPRGTDVAVVLDLMIHDIDIILSFVRSPVTRIDANGVAVVSDSVDIANARLQFGNGCVANVTASRISQKKMRKMRLFQPNEYIAIDFSEGSAEVFRLLDGETPETPGTMMLGEIGAGKHRRTIVYEQPEVKEVNALQYEIDLFARTIREGGVPVVSGEDGRRALEVARRIMDTIQQQTVRL
jgi:predicted dehydrogenase